jgi:protein-S-isoprenylcysteine O-methyltransferase Ste14
MNITTIIIISCWVIFISFWIISAFRVKKNIGGTGPWRRSRVSWIIRIIVIIAVGFFVSQRIFVRYATGPVNHPVRDYFVNTFGSSAGISGVTGASICVLGIALAIWARVHLGKEWSSYPTLKENHRLITSGPYAYVRHPIYTGMLVAMFGSGLAGGLPWLIYFFVFLAVFLRRVHNEENLMMKQFPIEYPEYKKHTWALFPYIF